MLARTLERLADVVVRYSVAVRGGDYVSISAPAVTAPLVSALQAAVVRAGGHPRVRLALEETADTLMFEGSEAQLGWLNPALVDEIETTDVLIGIEASSNTRRRTNVDPARAALAGLTRRPLLDRYLERAEAGELRWVVTGFPSDAAAQDAEMSVGEYADFMARAALLDDGDPVARWQELAGRLERIAAFLNTRDELRVIAEETDLRLRFAGREWKASTGRENFPDGEVFSGPVESSVEGTISFTFPAIFHGREVEGVRLRFEGGEVVEATARRGEEYLREMIAMDEGARRVGEFAFGMNEAVTAFTRSILFDEKIGGTVHLALGKSYPETGGKNESALHWDMICDLRRGGEVSADGQPVYRDGRFLDGLF